MPELLHVCRKILDSNAGWHRQNWNHQDSLAVESTSPPNTLANHGSRSKTSEELVPSAICGMIHLRVGMRCGGGMRGGFREQSGKQHKGEVAHHQLVYTTFAAALYAEELRVESTTP